MEDVLTEIPPPSRFFQEDLNNFVPPLETLPSPFILFSNPKPHLPLHPSLVIIAMSLPSLYVFQHVRNKTLIGSLIMPEIPFSGNAVEPSLGDKSCDIYSLGDADNSVLLVCVQFSVSPERSHMFARSLIGEQIIPERVLILDSIQSRNFRGKLSLDETYVFKLETSPERKWVSEGSGSSMLKNLEYFPSGSVMDGLGAATLSRCELKKIKGTLCLTWPESGPAVVTLVRSLLHKVIMPGFKLSLTFDDKDRSCAGKTNAQRSDSELYT